MFDQVRTIVERFEELNRLLATPEVATDPEKLRIYAQEQAELRELVDTYREYERLSREMDDAKRLREEESDPDMVALIDEEIDQLGLQLRTLEQRLRELLIPPDPRDERNVIMEIRAGAGGEEAALFAADLFRMYSMYAAKKGWKTRVLSANETGIGGYKEIIFEVQGKGAFSRLKYESGVHRVQRIPVTEASGRIHTSTATVAVLPQAEDVDVEIKEDDLRIDVFRASGHGGQGVNTTDSAVRITHLPTGIVVQCQNERSQLQNRAQAMEVLRARLYTLQYEAQLNERDQTRRKQVGSGERSEKIRTYNFPQNRVTDHRIGYSSYQLEEVLAGELDEFIERLAANEQAERLAEQPVA